MNTILHVVRASANLFLLAGPSWPTATNNGSRAAASVVSTLISGLLSPIDRYGADGADQATTVTQGTNAIARLVSDDASRDVILWFQSIQCTMSYAVAGWAKMCGRPWRDGSAVKDIVRTKTYGHEGLWKLLESHPLISKAANYGVLVWECAFPAIYFLPTPLSRAFSATGMLFHIVNGPAMGLWRFAFAFGSLHPALRYTIEGSPRREALRTLAAYCTAGMAAALTMGWVGYGRRRSRLRDVLAKREQVATRHGNVLPLELTADTGTGPVVVFENGLLGLPEQFHWIQQDLHSRGVSSATYIRAAYLPDAGTAQGHYQIDHAVDELVDVIEHVRSRREGRPLILIGHSFGAELIRRAGLRAPESVVGTVALDPTHPNQFRASALQAGSKQTFTDHLVLFRSLITARLGEFLVHPDWVRTLPDQVKKEAFDQYADPALWYGGQMEWNAVLGEMPDDASEVATIDSSLVISAGRTITSDSVLDRLHQELAGQRHVVVDDVTHESMLSNRAHSLKCAQHIHEFITAIPQTTNEETAA
ncbi:alpha/beta fold hydrolase [Arthrobacter sp. EH-1B-1]|uniref:Alpha/beta fold hydrolase n=1 Tax=Arthrobacter vasquezii TaxID=2977629 RepID=A0ABT6CSD5_9MICC|nr:alpha/beta fold hydrolase [Arthrobacter vasquezii]MDF9276951.1 alpha/beta fold hydrolase [Arthrobacter vasquezii]